MSVYSENYTEYNTLSLNVTSVLYIKNVPFILTT